MEEKTKKSMSDRMRRGAGLLAVLMFLVALLSFGYPMFKKNSVIKDTGEAAAGEMRSFALALSHYAHQDLERLRTSPATDEKYRDLCGLLDEARLSFGYQNLYIITRESANRYVYLAGGQKPGEEYPLNIYQASRKTLEAIYAGKVSFGYANGFATTQDLEEVVSAYLPVYGSGNSVIALLGIDSNAGNTAYHLVGPVDLHLVGLSALILMALAVGLVLILEKLREQKESKPETVEQGPSAGESAPEAEQTAGPPESEPAAAPLESLPETSDEPSDVLSEDDPAGSGPEEDADVPSDR